MNNRSSWILGIDYGTKRVGLAEAESSLKIPFPLRTVFLSDLWLFLDEYVASKEVLLFIVGVPDKTWGMSCPVEKDIRSFMRDAATKYPQIPTIGQSERFSSKSAFRDFILPIHKKKKRRDKSLVDKVSASLILEYYFTEHR